MVRNTLVVFSNVSTTSSRLSTANCATTVTARSSARSALRKLPRSSARRLLASATWSTNVRTVWSFSAIVPTSTSRETIVSAKSLRWPDIVLIAWASSRVLRLNSSPLPFSAAAPLSMNLFTARVVFFEPAIPVAKSLMVSSTSSKSTGEAVRSTSISAPSASFAPPS